METVEEGKFAFSVTERHGYEVEDVPLASLNAPCLFKYKHLVFLLTGEEHTYRYLDWQDQTLLTAIPIDPYGPAAPNYFDKSTKVTPLKATVYYHNRDMS